MSNPHHEVDQAPITSKDNNKTVITIKPRGFNIVWGNDPRYWRLPKQGEDTPAELVQVSWLEVTGSATLEAGKKYEISFNVSLKPDAFGWSGCQVYMMAKLGKRGRYSWKKVEPLPLKSDIPAAEKFQIEVKNGSETQLLFGLYEVWSGKWKGGLHIHHATIKEVD